MFLKSYGLQAKTGIDYGPLPKPQIQDETKLSSMVNQEIPQRVGALSD